MPTQPAVGPGGAQRPGLNPSGGSNPQAAVGMGAMPGTGPSQVAAGFPPAAPPGVAAAMSRGDNGGPPRTDMDSARRDASGMQDF
jgi:hypothetical protein